MFVPSFTSLENVCQQIGWLAAGGRLKLSRWGDRWDANSRQRVLLPTGQQGVVSAFLGLRKPLQNGRRKVPTSFCKCWISTFLAPSPALAGPIDPTSQAARLPGLYLWAQGQANREKPQASGHRTAPLEDLSG